MTVLALALAMGSFPSARAGTIDREFFDLIGPGTSVEDLVNSGRLGGPADLVTPLLGGVFKTRSAQGDEYGSRLRGFIQAPATGDFTFFIRSDDASQLSLSTDHQPASAVVIAKETRCCTALFSGDRLSERRSAPRRLEKGKTYYLEVLHKDSRGDDFIEVGWQRPDGVQETIPLLHVMPWTPQSTTPQIEEQPQNVGINAGNPVLIWVTVRAAQPVTFRWLKDGTPVADANLQSLSIPTALLTDTGRYTCEVTGSGGAKVTSSAAVVTVTPDTTPPTVTSAELNTVGQQLRVFFSEKIGQATATVLANFSVSGGVTLSSPQLDAKGRSVLLKTSALTAGSKDFALTARGVADVSGNVMAQATVPVLLAATESFTANLGIFDKTRNGTADGASFTFSNTGNSGGQPGEVGGLIFRRSSPNAIYVASARLGGTLSLSQDLFFRGRMLFRNRNFDGSLSIGFLSSVEGLDPVVGFNWAEPNSATGPGAFRGFLSVGGGLGDFFPWPNGDPVEFEFRWNAATGVATAVVNGETHVREPGPRDTQLNAFIIGSYGGSDRTDATEWFIDDLTFSVASVPSAPSAISVDIVSPSPGRIFPAGADITVTAAPTASQGTVAKVEFFATAAGGAKTKIGETTQSPHSVVWRRVFPGEYTLSATASSSAGQTANSSDIKITVQPGKSVTTATETFDTGLSKFTLEVRNHENGNDFGFANSNQAGGKAGEFGGILVRTLTTDAAYVGNNNLGGVLTPATQRIVLKGKLRIIPGNFDGLTYIGYINSQNLGVRLGINLAEPGGGFQPNYRAAVVVPGGSGPTFGLEPDLIHEIDLVWDPNAGTFSGKIGTHPVNVSGNPGQAALDALILGTFDAGSARPELAHQVFLDDLTFSVIGVPSVTENFDTTLGTFDGSKNPAAGGNNLGFSNTANAGGKPGEAGGTLARTTLADAAYIGDLTLGGLLSQSEPITMRGRFFLESGTFDGDMFLGYADTSNLGNRLGIQFTEPGGDFRPNFRVRVRVNDSTSAIIGVAPGRPWQFDLTWDPAAGTLKGTVAGQAINHTASPGAAQYDAFILGTFGAGSNNPSQNGKLLVDELTYNIVSDAPALVVRLKEPASNALFGSGASVTLTAEATAQRGNIQRVEFFARTGGGAESKIAEATKAPYSATWSNVPAGDHVLTATVTTDAGQKATSTEVKISVIRLNPVALRTATFDGGLGLFQTELRNKDNGNAFGFSNTLNAGGKAGELGGVFARTSTANAAYVGDTKLGGRLLPAFQDLVIKGKLYLNDQNFDGNLYIGYVDTQNLGVFLGVNISEPGGGVAPNFRGFARIPGANTALIPLAATAVHEFDLAWKASTRTLTGKLAGQDVKLTADPGMASFDAFVVGAFGVGSGNPAQLGEMFVDDLTYTFATEAAALPSLSVARAGANMVLSWSGEGFRLQTRDGFGPGTAWADATAQVTTQAGGFSASVAPAAGARFWRLTK